MQTAASRKPACCLLLVVVGVVLISACSAVGPNYRPPVVAVPDAWSEAATEGLDQGQSSIQTWWTALGDPTLEELVAGAEEANHDLRVAASRIREARARLGFAAGERLPQVDASGSYSYGQASDEGAIPAPPGGFDATSLFSLGFDATWEIDFFGRIRRSIESAEAGYEASIESYRDILVSLFADVALNYVELRTLQRRLEYARANVEAQRESLRLANVRFENGVTSALDPAQAESNLANTEAAIPSLEAALRFALNRLAVLLGLAPGAVDETLSSAGPIPAPASGLVVGLPADLLRQRPDVRRAERELASQTALIGVATADLYPRFSLSGTFAFESTDLSDLADGDTFGLVLPAFRWNLFDRKRIRNRIEIEEERAEQAFVRYEQAVLFALEDVEDAMVGYAQESRRRSLLAAAAAASERAVELAEIQYTSGLTDFQNLLDAQRSLFVQQDQLAASEGLVVKNLIALYKALGGGWDPSAVPAAARGAGESGQETSGDEPEDGRVRGLGLGR